MFFPFDSGETAIIMILPEENPEKSGDGCCAAGEASSG
jgi:hypothetical protein